MKRDRLAMVRLRRIAHIHLSTASPPRCTRHPYGWPTVVARRQQQLARVPLARHHTKVSPCHSSLLLSVLPLSSNNISLFF